MNLSRGILKLVVLLVLAHQSVQAAPTEAAASSSYNPPDEAELQQLIERFIVEKTNYQGNDVGVLNLLRVIGREAVVSERFPLIPPGENEQTATLEECPICYSPLGRYNTTTTQCGHKFHLTCLDQWKLQVSFSFIERQRDNQQHSIRLTTITPLTIDDSNFHSICFCSPQLVQCAAQTSISRIGPNIMIYINCIASILYYILLLLLLLQIYITLHNKTLSLQCDPTNKS